jgi:hypothetical protein
MLLALVIVYPVANSDIPLYYDLTYPVFGALL